MIRWFAIDYELRNSPNTLIRTANSDTLTLIYPFNDTQLAVRYLYLRFRLYYNYSMDISVAINVKKEYEYLPNKNDKFLLNSIAWNIHFWNTNNDKNNIMKRYANLYFPVHEFLSIYYYKVYKYYLSLSNINKLVLDKILYPVKLREIIYRK